MCQQELDAILTATGHKESESTSSFFRPKGVACGCEACDVCGVGGMCAG